MADTANESAAEQQQRDAADNDECKIFVSRIPTSFDEAPVKRLLEDKLGEGSVVSVALIYPQEEAEDDNETKHEKEHAKKEPKQDHRGFAFVTLDSHQHQQDALALGTVRGGLKATSTKKHTLYLRPIVRNDDNEADTEPQTQGGCFLWANFRCPYGDDCKFAHEGNGGCLPPKTDTDPTASKKKKKCFNFRKGKCKAGDACLFSHDFEVQEKNFDKRDDLDKDCITWKKKGKCNKGDACPYRHDEELRQKALEKMKRKRDPNKERQPLSVRVFGLNYDTTESDVRLYFDHCGPIVELTFPKFEDSGRSKGYCGILFQSPKAVAKAIELDGKELHGRWLQVQAGKMYLKQWEEQQESRKQIINDESSPPQVGEFGQKVKRRKQHGFKE